MSVCVYLCVCVWRVCGVCGTFCFGFLLYVVDVNFIYSYSNVPVNHAVPPLPSASSTTSKLSFWGSKLSMVSSVKASLRGTSEAKYVRGMMYAMPHPRIANVSL